MMPKDLPHWRTVYGYFVDWRDDGTLDLIHDTLREELRKKTEKPDGTKRKAEPSAGIIDSQSLRGADTVGKDTRGYDAGKKVQGRKRHIVTDTLGLLLVVVVTAASVQDRDGGVDVPRRRTAGIPGCVTSSPTAAMPVDSSCGPGATGR